MNETAFFDADWLSLREAADQKARSRELVDRLVQLLKERPGGRFIDLGSGHGSNLRYLADHLPTSADWLLLDQDADLLERARTRIRASHPERALHTRQLDLRDLSLADLTDARLVTASALFDLASKAWIERLAVTCRDVGAAVLFVLTVDGRRGFEDALGRPLDATDPLSSEDCWMADRFNAHQRQTKGLGDALGPDAARVLPQTLAAAGFAVSTRSSDWQLRADDPLTRSLGLTLLDGWRDAVLDIAPEAGARIQRWHAQRSQALLAGELGLRVGHVDVLGLPMAAQQR